MLDCEFFNTFRTLKTWMAMAASSLPIHCRVHGYTTCRGCLIQWLMKLFQFFSHSLNDGRSWCQVGISGLLSLLCRLNNIPNDVVFALLHKFVSFWMAHRQHHVDRILVSIITCTQCASCVRVCALHRFVFDNSHKYRVGVGVRDRKRAGGGGTR